MYEVVAIFQREDVGMSEDEVLNFFRVASNSVDELDRKEIMNAVRYAVAEIEKATHYALVGKDVDLYYYEIRKDDVLPYAPCSVISLSIDNQIAEIGDYFSSGVYPVCKKDATNMSVSVTGGYSQMPDDWKELVLRLAAIRLDTKGGSESEDKEVMLMREIKRRKRGQFLIC